MHLLSQARGFWSPAVRPSRGLSPRRRAAPAHTTTITISTTAPSSSSSFPCFSSPCSPPSVARLLAPQLAVLPRNFFVLSDELSWRPTIVASAASYNYSPLQNEAEDPSELAKREKVAKRLESLARYFRRLGSLGFWSQLVCTVVSAVILAFSVAISGTPTSQATFYSTAGGITAAFLSVFWSFGYIRLAEKLRSTVNDLKKAPPRAEVVKNLRTGIIINLLGMGLTLLGMQATVGTLVAKALTSTASPFLQGAPAGYSPVLALDVFLVQASANTVLSHYLGLLFSLELLRSVTVAQPPPDSVIPKVV